MGLTKALPAFRDVSAGFSGWFLLGSFVFGSDAEWPGDGILYLLRGLMKAAGAFSFLACGGFGPPAVLIANCGRVGLAGSQAGWVGARAGRVGSRVGLAGSRPGLISSADSYTGVPLLENDCVFAGSDKSLPVAEL